jgi:hypothetical protein
VGRRASAAVEPVGLGSVRIRLQMVSVRMHGRNSQLVYRHTALRRYPVAWALSAVRRTAIRRGVREPPRGTHLRRRHLVYSPRQRGSAAPMVEVLAELANLARNSG